MQDISQWGDLDGYFEACRPKLKTHSSGRSIDSQLTVAVRVRPIDSRETALRDRVIVNPEGANLTLDLTKIVQGMESATFAYDHVYGPESRCPPICATEASHAPLLKCIPQSAGSIRDYRLRCCGACVLRLQCFNLCLRAGVATRAIELPDFV